MDKEEYARRAEALRPKLYRTALCYLGQQQDALDVLDEAVYRGLCGLRKLRQPEFFDTWLTRILLNECSRELKRRNRWLSLEKWGKEEVRDLDQLPLQEAIRALPKELEDVIILRFFSGCTQAETAQTLNIPQGTVATRQRRALQLLKLELEESVQ